MYKMSEQQISIEAIKIRKNGTARVLKSKKVIMTNIDPYKFGSLVDIIVTVHSKPDLVRISLDDLKKQYPTAKKLGVMIEGMAE